MEVVGGWVLGWLPGEEGTQPEETLRGRRSWGERVIIDLSEGGYKEGEGDPRDPKPSPSEIVFRSIPISAEVCASDEGAEEVRGGI